MDNQKKIDMLVTRMIEQSEADFTLKVLEPLYKSMGYKTDYHGGQNEGGKDLICCKNDDFGEKELTVIQVKKVSESAAASAAHSFSEIVTQISQALEKAVPDLDGLKRIPDKVIFITPYKINTRALESRFEGLASLRSRGARVYDGSQIAKQLIDRRLPIVSELLGKEFEFREIPTAGFSNRDLLSALSYGKERSVRHFYTDLDFGIGKVRTGTLLDINFTPVTVMLEIDEADWKSLKNIITRVEDYFVETITNPTVADVENNFNLKSAEWISKKNQSVIGEIKSDVEEIIELLAGLDYAMNTISPEISSRQKSVGMVLREYESSEGSLNEVVKKAASALRIIKLYCSKSIDRISGENEKNLDLSTANDLIESAEQINSEWPTMKKFIEAIKITSLVSIKGSIDANTRKLTSITEDLAQLLAKRIPEPKYRVEINGNMLARQLNIEQQKLREGIERLQNTGKTDKNETKVFFDHCLQILRIIDAIFSNSRLLQSIGVGTAYDQIDGDVCSSRISSVRLTYKFPGQR